MDAGEIFLKNNTVPICRLKSNNNLNTDELDINYNKNIIKIKIVKDKIYIKNSNRVKKFKFPMSSSTTAQFFENLISKKKIFVKIIFPKYSTISKISQKIIDNVKKNHGIKLKIR